MRIKKLFSDYYSEPENVFELLEVGIWKKENKKKRKIS